ncbi:MAG: protein kinase [Pirellulaceae bacterium]|nr:protein kinase [Pirellulaceae bacterium]
MTDDPRLAELLDQWEEAEEEGREITAEQLCDDCPELLDEMRRQIQALREIDGRLLAHQDGISAEASVDRFRTDDTVVMHAELTDLKFHAKGGLGLVCVAGDQGLNRELAVKFIRRRLSRDHECRERFQMEAEITSRLEHPGVVPVHGMGETENGRLFYAMRFIQGQTLEAAIERHHDRENPYPTAHERHLKLRELLGHFVAACKTIAYAHNRGIVHRDIKPANMMLGRYGETLVVDWGLAMAVGREGVFKQSSEKTLTPVSGSGSPDSSGSGAGTPAYMSPEQASFSMDLGPPSDIYSLGATLYKVLTGNAPFQGNAPDLRPLVIRGQFPRPSKAAKDVPTALELAKDIENYLADSAVSAYDEPAMHRLARWSRRNWGVVQGLLGGLIVVMLAVVMAAVLLGRQAQREGKLKTAALVSQRSEYELRKQGLSVSAQFAARTIANQVDIRWRILEKEAADAELQAALAAVNQDPKAEANWEPLQSWIDAVGAGYDNVQMRSLFVNARDGTQVARYPSRTETGERYSSLGANYSYRDYFHGRGKDFYDDREAQRPPLAGVHNSTAIESTNDGDLAVAFSVPIRARNEAEPLGVLAMSIHLGSFAGLEVNLPVGQEVLLVDTRRYYMRRQYPEPHEERGEGLVLHHDALKDLLQRSSLPHVDDATIQHMLRAKDQWTADNETIDNLLPEGFDDPLSDDKDSRSLAAFAPVIVRSRPADQRDTGWFVIIQQAE